MSSMYAPSKVDVCDVAVVGGGLVGLSTALELAKRGARVVSIGAQHPNYGDTSRAAGAMLCVVSEETSGAGLELSASAAQLRMRGMELLKKQLNECGVEPCRDLSWRDGLFVVANSHGNTNDKKNLAHMVAVARKIGLECDYVSVHDIPGLRPHDSVSTIEGIFVRGEASVDALAVLQCMRDSCSRHDRIQIANTRVEKFARQGREFRVVCEDGTELITSKLVLATGGETLRLLVASGTSAAEVGIPPVFAARGFSLRVQLNVPVGVTNAIRTPNRGFACGAHIVPQLDPHTLYIGATNRFVTQPEFDSFPLVSEALLLLGRARDELHVGIRDARIANQYVGYRPLTVTKEPLVGETAVPGLFVCTATYRNGFTLAALAASLVADAIQSSSGNSVNPFSPCEQLKRASTLPKLNFAELAASAVGALLEESANLPPGAAQQIESAYLILLETLLGEGLPATIPQRAVQRLLERAAIPENIPAILELLLGSRTS